MHVMMPLRLARAKLIHDCTGPDTAPSAIDSEVILGSRL